MTELKVDADPKSVGDLFQKKAVYRVPVQQRQYSWDTEQFEDLWNDINKGIRIDRPHHLNEIKLVPYREKSPKEFHIIDGQQRLTTVSILIAALRDEYERRELGQKYIEELQALLETKDKDANTIRCLKLLNEDDDDRQYESVYHGGENSSQIDGQVGAAYRYFKEKLKDCSFNELNEIRFYTIHRLSLVQTRIEDRMQAYVMFSTTNARGLELSDLEVVKAILLEIATRRNEDEDEAQTRWMNALEHAQSADSSKPARAIKDVFFVNSDFNAPVEIKGGFVEFMQRIFAEAADDSVNGLLRWLNNSLEEYKRLKNAHVSKFDRRENEHINALIRQFNAKNPHSGIIIYWLLKNIKEPAELIEAFDWASRLSLRLYLADVRSHQKRTAMHKTIRSLIDDGISPKRAFKKQIHESTPDDRALEIELNSRTFRKNVATRMILYRIEVEHFNGAVGGSEYPTAGEDFELEHIAPEQSFSAKKYRKWRRVLDHDEDRFDRQRKRLGNLTLLRSRQNQAAGAEPFRDKCEKYQTSDFGMSRDIAERYDNWGFEQIQARTKSLANLTVQTFSADGYTQRPASETETDGSGRVGQIQQFLEVGNE
jgi:hypothetical protein